MLRGVSPENIQKRFKAFFYGDAGAGKTTSAISFPSPYVIDTEKGADREEYVDKINEVGGVIFQTSDFEEMVKEIKELLSTDHPYKTLVIDPLTIVYDQLLDSASEKVGTEFGRHYGEANKKMKKLMNLLLRIDMNVIITSHSKKEYAQDLTVVGNTFDCYKKLDYLFDLVIEVQKRRDFKRIGLIKKSRIKSFKEGECFDFCFKEISERYGSDIINKKSSFVKLASEEQVMEIIELVRMTNTSNESIEKWLNRAKSSDFSEMKYEEIQKCIDFLKEKFEIKQKELGDIKQ